MTTFVTSVVGNSFFNIPADKQPTNKFLKKKDEDKPLSEQVLGRVFSEIKKHEKQQSDQEQQEEK